MKLITNLTHTLNFRSLCGYFHKDFTDLDWDLHPQSSGYSPIAYFPCWYAPANQKPVFTDSFFSFVSYFDDTTWNDVSDPGLWVKTC